MGEAVRIATGAPIPEGANAVVMEEYTVPEEDNLEVEMSINSWRKCFSNGRRYRNGDIVLKKGKILKPQDLALIASAGYSKYKGLQKTKNWSYHNWK